MVMDPGRVVPDPDLPIRKGAIPGWRRGPRRLLIYYNHLIRCVAEHCDFPDLAKVPFRDIPPEIKKIVLEGSGDEPIRFDYWMRGRQIKIHRPFEGVLANLERRYHETESDAVRERLRAYMTRKPCPACGGARLKPASLAVRIGGMGIHEFNALPIGEADRFLAGLELTPHQESIAREVIREIRARLGFLENVGLGYLSLNRESGSLSGGEAQRIRLATQLGCGLVGVLYILDEPSIGLHQRDNEKLLDTLERLRDIGNTVVVVEHDLDTIRRANHVIDLGPGAGRHGGRLVGSGTARELEKITESLTGQFLAGTREIAVPSERLPGNGQSLRIRGARHNNLKNIDVRIPLGTLCCVTGVSGSGKSSLINDILMNALSRKLGIDAEPPGEHDSIEGMEHIGKMIVIDQSPIGRTPRSNPATYIEAFSPIRTLYSQVPDAKLRGYKPGRFSFNVKGGRCEECQGDGIIKIEMQFLPDVYVTCSACQGKRFNRETLNVQYKRRNIAEVLDMTAEEASEFFDKIPTVHRKLKTLVDVGLGYIHLGQAATTLSGGEAQRVKLAAELAKIPRGHTLYILDEPTTGLHVADIEKLMQVLVKLRDLGNTVLIIEHNLDVIKTADHVVDLGPEGGEKGGKVIATGTPEEIAAKRNSYTGRYLKALLKPKKR
jgi:excinuclease ABC subunit A